MEKYDDFYGRGLTVVKLPRLGPGQVSPPQSLGLSALHLQREGPEQPRAAGCWWWDSGPGARANGSGSVLGLLDYLTLREECRFQDTCPGGPMWVPVLATRGSRARTAPSLTLSIPWAECTPALYSAGRSRKSSRACFSSFVKSHLC